MTPAYFDGFLTRNRPVLVAVLDRQLAARPTRYPAGTESPVTAPDLWSASQRTAANLAAMRVAASKRPDEMTPADRAALAAYSGWGGLSILSAAAQFPTGFPVPEERGLIHEYYTPSKVAREVARVIQPLLADLPNEDGTVLALEPSAGHGARLASRRRSRSRTSAARSSIRRAAASYCSAVACPAICPIGASSRAPVVL